MSGILVIAFYILMFLCSPRNLLMLFGVISKEDWYNTESLSWIQILYLRVFGGVKKGELYNRKPWWGGHSSSYRCLAAKEKPDSRKGYSDIMTEMKALKAEYYSHGLRGRALKMKVKAEMEGRYRGDGRILKIIQIVLMILFFFL